MYILMKHILNRNILVFKISTNIAHIRIRIKIIFPKNFPNTLYTISSIFLPGFFLYNSRIINIRIIVGIIPIIGPIQENSPPISAKYIP